MSFLLNGLIFAAVLGIKSILFFPCCHGKRCILRKLLRVNFFKYILLYIMRLIIIYRYICFQFEIKIPFVSFSLLSTTANKKIFPKKVWSLRGAWQGHIHFWEKLKLGILTKFFRIYSENYYKKTDKYFFHIFFAICRL